MLIMGFLGFILGFFLPLLASRFGKIISSDPGSMLYLLCHRPRFPQSKKKKRIELLKFKWQKMLYFSIGWGAFLSCLFIFISSQYPPVFWGWLGIFCYIICVCIIIDQQFFLLPDFWTIPLLLLGFGFSLATPFISPVESLIGAVFGYTVCVASVFFVRLFKQTEFGGGDVKMLTALGAWLGYMGLCSTLVLSFVLFLIPALLQQKKVGAYGPALGFASLIVLFWIY